MELTEIILTSVVISTMSVFILLVVAILNVLLRRKIRISQRLIEKEPVAEAVERLDREAEEIRDKFEAGSCIFDDLKIRYGEVTSELQAIEVGLSPPTFKFDDCERLKREILQIRNQQLQAILSGNGVSHRSNWTISNSAADGAKMTTAYKELVLKAFNDEFEVIRKKLRHSTGDVASRKLWRLQDQLDKLGEPVGVHLEDMYVSLKEQELAIWHQDLLRKEREKQEEKSRRELLKAEGGNVRGDLLEELNSEVVEKERALERAKALAREIFDRSNQARAKEIEQLQKEIEKLRAKQERALSQAQQTRAGYIYVISNAGSFGDDIVKIGLTRRLDPMERVKELGDASVPFRFDVHAIAFTEDAPAIERALHNCFNDFRVNKDNPRKEFFQATPQQVEAEFLRLGIESDWYFENEAREYRESVLRREAEQQLRANLAEEDSRLSHLPETI